MEIQTIVSVPISPKLLKPAALLCIESTGHLGILTYSPPPARLILMPRINHSGTSTYSLDNKNITALKYTQSLEKHNILVKAKNFLVFQGDVEAVASQSGKDLCRLIDQISG